MTRLSKWLGFCGLAAGTIGCASTTWNGYPGGTLKYSEIDYNYTAQPVLKDPAGKSYQLQTDQALSAVKTIPALEKKGVRRAESGADVVINVKSGEITHEPGGFGLGHSYTPALYSTMPITIDVKDKAGRSIIERELKDEEYLELKGAKQYKTREEATAAMTEINTFLKSAADAKVKEGASGTVDKNLGLIAKELFEPRQVSVSLPAVRSAGKVDMEAAYTLLSKAKGDEQVKAALAAYTALGVEHKKPDGTTDTVGNYGVLCGSASAKVLSGDLAGAWQDTKNAWKMFPTGKEHLKILEVLRQQQEQAGVAIIPKEEYDEMVNQENKAADGATNEYAKKANQTVDKAVDKLKNLFGGGK